MPHALVVDDEFESASSLRTLIAGQRFTVAVVHTLRDARRQIALQQPDILLLDVALPDGNGMDLLSDEQLVATEIVLCTGHACKETSVQALRLGAADYLVKPVKLQQLQGVLSRILNPALLKAEVDELNSTLPTSGHFGPLWGNSPAMQLIYEQILRVAATSVTVFITGESGTGKEVVAQAVHDMSRRRKLPFLAVNCGAISPNLIESELFGHEKGSFTGADRQHQGFFERASGGTLFLDEITEMPLELQVKLLRVLETGRFMRVGSAQSHESDVRIIAATNRHPHQAVAAGRLREDLMYRLNVFPLDLPPLRNRLSDVPLLAQHFLRAIAVQEGREKKFSRLGLAQLSRHSWPGNVRELRNVVQRAYVMSQDDTIDERWMLPPGGPSSEIQPSLETGDLAGVQSKSGQTTVPVARSMVAANDAVRGLAAETVSVQIGTSMAHAERLLVLATLRHYHHHKERTAAALGISVKTLYNRLKDYGADGHHPSGSHPPDTVTGR